MVPKRRFLQSSCTPSVLPLIYQTQLSQTKLLSLIYSHKSKEAFVWSACRRTPLYNQPADDRQWWKFDSLEVIIVIEMCEILVLKEGGQQDSKSWVVASLLGGFSAFWHQLPIACSLLPLFKKKLNSHKINGDSW